MFEPQFDPRTVEELFNAALCESDEELLWPIIAALHARGSSEVFQRASKLCYSECSQERGLGARILGQLGLPDRTFPNEGLALLLELLAREYEAEVLSALLSALSHYHRFDLPELLAKYATHPDSDVRWSLVLALSGYAQETAINQLILLSNDCDSDVRDWATFALGTQLDLDTPAIRAALLDRLDDGDGHTRAEAIMGLVSRNDPRVLPVLQRELASEVVGSLSIEAAEICGDASLHPLLLELRSWWDVFPELLERAISACAPANQA